MVWLGSRLSRAGRRSRAGVGACALGAGVLSWGVGVGAVSADGGKQEVS